MPSVSGMILLICSFLSIYGSSSASSWKATLDLNPGCVTECEKFNLFHLGAYNDSVSVHFLFSASDLIYPSVLMLMSLDRTAKPKIDWELMLNDSSTAPKRAISLNKPSQSYAVSFIKLVEYNDVNDMVDMTNIQPSTDQFKPHLFHNLVWQLTENPLVKTDTTTHTLPLPIEAEGGVIAINFMANETTDNTTNLLSHADSHVDLRFMISLSDSHNPTMPGLQFVPGLSLQFELALINLTTNFTSGRFGLQLDFTSLDPLTPKEDYRQVSLVSINDEVTPGIFEMLNVKLDERVGEADDSTQTSPVTNRALSSPAAFFQTRPVCYTSMQHREIKNSRDAKLTRSRQPLDSTEWSDHERTLARFFYGDRLIPSPDPVLLTREPPVGMRRQNITFGTTEDGFYNKSKCINWVFVYVEFFDIIPLVGTHFQPACSQGGSSQPDRQKELFVSLALLWAASVGFGAAPADNLSPLLIGMISLSAIVVLSSLLFGTMILLILRKRGTGISVSTQSFRRLVTDDDASGVSISPTTAVRT